MKLTTTCTTCGNAIPETPLYHPDYGPAMCVRCRYSAPRKAAAIERDDPAFEAAAAGYAVPPPAHDGAGEWNEHIAAWLAWLAGSGNPKLAGQRAIVAAHVCGKSSAATDRELARKLNIAPSRISQYRAEITGLFGSVGRCNSRQKTEARRNK